MRLVLDTYDNNQTLEGITAGLLYLVLVDMNKKSN